MNETYEVTYEVTVIYKGKVIKEATGEAAMAGGCVAVSPVAAG